MADHAHHDKSANASARGTVLGLTGAFLAVEVVGGILIGSLALISDAAHMATDTAAIALAAIKLAQRPPDSRRTFGYQRFEILAAAFNAIMLFAVMALRACLCGPDWAPIYNERTYSRQPDGARPPSKRLAPANKSG